MFDFFVRAGECFFDVCGVFFEVSAGHEGEEFGAKKVPFGVDFFEGEVAFA